MSLLAHIHGQHVHARRVRVLAETIARLLPEGDLSVIDVGCGDGRLAEALLSLRPNLKITGVDVLVRPDARIQTLVYDGKKLPAADQSYDAALLVDVLHHTSSPCESLLETVRIASRCVVIKDHLLQGFLAGPTLRFMDRIGNRRHGVALPHNYLSPVEWESCFAQAGVHVKEKTSVANLYPWPASWLFGRSLHFAARLERR